MADLYNSEEDFDSDGEFRMAVSDLLDELLDQLDEIEADIDPMLTPGTLNVRFPDGNVYILSQQTPTHELWLSAEMTAWHFLRRGGTWVERDSGEPMLPLLNRLMSDRLGMTVALTA
ncbi:MAG: iron donor protein CyaY [Alphaproteobacteria bacterium]|nr:iron donor protein CyaY [Alphaproteobacteria bacterium]